MDPRVIIGQELRDRAGWVHQRLSVARSLRTPLSEETITESVLLDLQVSLGAHLKVGTFSKSRESRVTGADWEWWFCDGVGDRLYGMRVQAKRLKGISTAPPGYDFSYMPRLSKVRQVDRLIAGAKQTRLPAVYALYNGPELDLNSFEWQCCSEKPDANTFGVSLLSADSARLLADAGTTTLADVGGLSLPWSCSALCKQFLRPEGKGSWPPGSGSLSLFAADSVSELMASDAERLGLSARQRVLDAAQGYRTASEAPAHVRRLLDRISGQQDPFDSLLDSLGDGELEEGPQGVGHVAVFVERTEGE